MKALFLCLCLLPVSLPAQEKENKVHREDFLKLTGDNWKGTLTYRDYGNDKIITIKSGLKVERAAENIFLFHTSYPDEPEMNSVDSVHLNKNGSMLDDESVIRRTMKGDTVIIVTEKTSSQDDSTLIHFRYTYKIHPHYFLITKVEKTQENEDYKERNRYLYKRD